MERASNAGSAFQNRARFLQIVRRARMTQFRLPSLLLCTVLFSLAFPLTAQNGWRVVPSESTTDHHPLPFARAIGIPATATYQGKKRKAFVIIHGTDKEARASLPANVHLGHPGIEVHIDGLDDLLPENRVELFDGPDFSDAATEIRAFAISITRGKQFFRARSSVDRYIGEYPESIVGPDGNVLGTSGFTKGARQTEWMQLLREMSNGFDKGRISIGGKMLSPNIEIDFSGTGITPLLKELLSASAQ